MLGAGGTLIPALALIGILLAWHIARRDKWTVQLNTVIGMYMESVLLALPLLALAAALARLRIGPLLAGGDESLINGVVITMGAGIYEEMIFRLVLLTLLSILLVDILGMKKNRAAVLMVVISGLMFSFYHYLGPEKFVWKTCLFRTLAGIYFGGIFLTRGFGVTAGSHAAYDMIICAIAGLS
jgi:membrane protease YdiL (CAAX protease family)